MKKRIQKKKASRLNYQMTRQSLRQLADERCATCQLIDCQLVAYVKAPVSGTPCQDCIAMINHCTLSLVKIPRSFKQYIKSRKDLVNEAIAVVVEENKELLIELSNR